MPEQSHFVIRVKVDMSAPVSTHIVESAVVNADVGKVWEAVSALDFSWWILVASSQLLSGLSAQTLDAVVQLKFKDGASWDIQLVELSSLQKSITFQIVGCEPSSSYSSALHTISLRKLTSTENATFVEWTTDFSNDANADVVVDSTFKRREAFKDLASFVASKK